MQLTPIDGHAIFVLPVMVEASSGGHYEDKIPQPQWFSKQ